jgi:hypothetical protein
MWIGCCGGQLSTRALGYGSPLYLLKSNIHFRNLPTGINISINSSVEGTQTLNHLYHRLPICNITSFTNCVIATSLFTLSRMHISIIPFLNHFSHNNNSLFKCNVQIQADLMCLPSNRSFPFVLAVVKRSSAQQWLRLCFLNLMSILSSSSNLKTQEMKGTAQKEVGSRRT